MVSGCTPRAQMSIRREAVPLWLTASSVKVVVPGGACTVTGLAVTGPGTGKREIPVAPVTENENVIGAANSGLALSTVKLPITGSGPFLEQVASSAESTASRT